MKLVVLGSGQDGGVPQAGCGCGNCRRARSDERYRRYAPSVAVLDETKGSFLLIDASPDLKYQLEMIADIGRDHGWGEPELAGIMLTHAHLGHICGLWQLGKEAMNLREMPVYCTPAVTRFLADNYPYDALVERRNIVTTEINDGEEFSTGKIRFTPVSVPHRNETADTMGFIISARKRLLYLPDVDCWTEPVLEKIRSVDTAILDGTFYTDNELPRYDEVPHPPIPDTIRQLEDARTEIIFTHINHTNPVNREGPEREYVLERGFGIAYDGMMLKI